MSLHSVRRAILGFALASIATLALAAPSLAQAPPTLAFEDLDATENIPPGPLPAGQVTITGTCDLSGGSLTFTITGLATGPYAGPFEENGTFTLGPLVPGPLGTVGSRTLLTFDASFSIHSPTGEVTGTKTLFGAPFVEVGNCQQDYLGIDPNGGNQVIGALRYTARIQSDQGLFEDRGRANVIARDTEPDRPSPFGDFFAEHFTLSDLPAPEPVAPTSSEQCKKDGWKNYPNLAFKNQGDCVSYVATHGRNPPNPR